MLMFRSLLGLIIKIWFEHFVFCCTKANTEKREKRKKLNAKKGRVGRTDESIKKILRPFLNILNFYDINCSKKENEKELNEKRCFLFPGSKFRVQFGRILHYLRLG